MKPCLSWAVCRKSKVKTTAPVPALPSFTAPGGLWAVCALCTGFAFISDILSVRIAAARLSWLSTAVRGSTVSCYAVGRFFAAFGRNWERCTDRGSRIVMKVLYVCCGQATEVRELCRMKGLHVYLVSSFHWGSRIVIKVLYVCCGQLFSLRGLYSGEGFVWTFGQLLFPKRSCIVIKVLYVCCG